MLPLPFPFPTNTAAMQILKHTFNARKKLRGEVLNQFVGIRLISGQFGKVKYLQEEVNCSMRFYTLEFIFLNFY